ncbi:hypothetical protein Cs7R123_14980 [Catellatospora sp. TT07R-123]|uniref:hypothetical protein n=1 Tax=Catellatospora sp. TT07R-123 TaxID=2733863 RepID=UPI001B11F3D0|nr:hypothetical protein [Catellatospora sp. TT07R-123]GHJ44156.1 hypothetical protein Cs7R123_14980 [Catellatospora sp. TT07R-123]
MEIRFRRSLAALNIAGTVIAMGFAVAGMADPSLLADGSGGAPFYALVYGARAIPLGAATIALFALGRWSALVPMLAVAGVVQAADALIGLRYGQPGMIFGGGSLAAVHLLSAWWIRRGLPSAWTVRTA